MKNIQILAQKNLFKFELKRNTMSHLKKNNLKNYTKLKSSKRLDFVLRLAMTKYMQFSFFFLLQHINKKKSKIKCPNPGLALNTNISTKYARPYDLCAFAQKVHWKILRVCA